MPAYANYFLMLTRLNWQHTSVHSGFSRHKQHSLETLCIHTRRPLTFLPKAEKFDKRKYNFNLYPPPLPCLCYVKPLKYRIFISVLQYREGKKASLGLKEYLPSRRGIQGREKLYIKKDEEKDKQHSTELNWRYAPKYKNILYSHLRQILFYQPHHKYWKRKELHHQLKNSQLYAI